MAEITSPVVLDETFADKMDELIAELQALSAPSATNVSVDATGMDVITATNAQGALKQLDSAVDSLDSNLAKKVKTVLRTSTTNANGGVSLGMTLDTEIVLNVIPRTANANVYALIVQTSSGAQWAIFKNSVDNSNYANQSITYHIIYSEV